MKIVYQQFIALFLFSIACTIAGLAQAQQTPVKIIVSDADDDHAAIAQATVQSTFFNIKTNNRGEVILRTYPANGFHVKVNADNYYPLEKHIFLKQDVTEYIIELHRLQDTLHTVIVTGYSQEGDNKNSVTSVLNQEKLRSNKGNDLGVLLQDVPGVSMLQTGATISKPVINGLHSNRIVILNNGVKQEGQQWGAEHAPEVDPSIASNIVVVKGADAVRYGADAIGGTILINPPGLAYGDALHGEAYLLGTSNAKLFGGGASAWSSFKQHRHWAWRVQASAKKGGNYKTAEYFLNNTGIQEINFSGEAGYKKDRWNVELYASHFNKEIGIFTGSHIGDTSDLFAIIQNGRPFEQGSFSYHIDAPRQKVNHQLYKLHATYDLKNKGSIQLQYAFQQNNRQEYDLRRGGRSATPSLDLVLQTQAADIHWKNNYNRKWKSQIGVSTEYQSNHSAPGTGVTPLIPNYKNIGAGLYAIQNYIQPRYELEAGLRYDLLYLNAKGLRSSYIYVDENGAEIPAHLPGEYVLIKNYYGGERTFQNVSGILGAHWKPGNQWRISSNIGLAWRPPQVNELYSAGLHHGTASIEIGDSTLTSETAYKWISAVAYKTKKLSFDLSGYVQYIKNYIFLQPSLQYQQSLRGSFPIFNFTQTDALYTGFDFSGRYSIHTHFDYLIKGALVLGRDISQDTYLPMIPPFQLSNALKFNIGSLGVFQDNYFTIESAYTAKQNRYEENTDFSDPPAAYHLWNAEINTRIAKGFNHSLICNIKANNILNVLYKDYLDRFRYYNHGMGRNIQLRLIYQF